MGTAIKLIIADRTRRCTTNIRHDRDNKYDDERDINTVNKTHTNERPESLNSSQKSCKRITRIVLGQNRFAF